MNLESIKLLKHLLIQMYVEGFLLKTSPINTEDQVKANVKASFALSTNCLPSSTGYVSK